MGLIPQTLSQSVERYGLGYIRPRHEEIARRLVCGQSQAEIARTLGINQGRLSIIINSPLFKIVVARLSKLRDDSTTDLQEELKALAPIAIQELGKLAMTSPSERLRLDASKDILDRAGLIKKGQGLHVEVNNNFHPVDLEKYRPQQTIEVTVTDIESDVQPVNTTIENSAEDMRLLEEALEIPGTEDKKDEALALNQKLIQGES